MSKSDEHDYCRILEKFGCHLLFVIKKTQNWIQMSINAQLFDQKKTDDRTFIEDCDKNSDCLKSQKNRIFTHLKSNAGCKIFEWDFSSPWIKSSNSGVSSSEIFNNISAKFDLFAFGVGKGQKGQIITFILQTRNQNRH